MKIPLEQWQEINNLICQAEAALKAADDCIVALGLEHAQAGNQAEARLLIELSKSITEHGPLGYGYLTHPQSEWTGGDSSDPKNFTLREPNIVPLGHRFPREQVEAAQEKASQ